jgi:hypothetical protein
MPTRHVIAHLNERFSYFRDIAKSIMEDDGEDFDEYFGNISERMLENFIHKCIGFGTDLSSSIYKSFTSR